MSPQSVTAVIPCFNNAATLQAVIDSVRRQGLTADQILVIDDASTDGSQSLASQAGVRFMEMCRNSGRGAVRAQAVDESSSPLLLACDATNQLDPIFLENALPWFEDPAVAAVFGRLVDAAPVGVAGRWRARHLFKQVQESSAHEHASLCTWAYVCRVEAFRQVGNFRRELRHSEDVELGDRLLAAGFKVVYDPSCLARPLINNTVTQCLERHWRWYVARHGSLNAGLMRRWIGLAWRSMAVKDLRAGDPAAALVSLCLPFHHWLRSR